MKTELKNRTLFFDGDSSWDSDFLMDAILSNGPDGIFSREKIPGIATKTECSSIPIPEWTIPKEYLEKDIVSELIAQAGKLGLIEKERVEMELNLYRDFGMIEFLQVLSFVKDKMMESNVIWGVGRGSSVSSYVLYLMGLHSVDSLKYDLDIREFLR